MLRSCCLLAGFLAAGDRAPAAWCVHTAVAASLQALVFCNSQPDAQALADQLCGLGYPAAFVSGSHAQVRGLMHDTLSASFSFIYTWVIVD
jgi:hypothetical protein